MNATRTALTTLAFAALLAMPAAAGSKSVSVEGGNIVLVDGGKRVTLTKSGRDSEPALSPDAAWV